jgi:hypothetical protein
VSDSLAWDECAWWFEFDGAWLDIYVPNASIEHWWRFLHALPAWGYATDLRVGDEIRSLPLDPASLVSRDLDVNDQPSRTLSIRVGEAILNCHFFSNDVIELDLDPREFRGQRDLDALVDFVTRYLAQHNCLPASLPRTCPNARCSRWTPREAPACAENRFAEHGPSFIAETLLRARMHAIAADAARALGDLPSNHEAAESPTRASSVVHHRAKCSRVSSDAVFSIERSRKLFGVESAKMRAASTESREARADCEVLVRRAPTTRRHREREQLRNRFAQVEASRQSSDSRVAKLGAAEWSELAEAGARLRTEDSRCPVDRKAKRSQTRSALPTTISFRIGT